MPASMLQTLANIAHTDLQQSLKQILEEILAQVVRHIGGHSGSTMLINDETGELEMVATFGLPADYIDRIYARDVPITCSPSGFVMKTGECYIVPNIFDEPRDRWWADLGKEVGFSAQLFMPMNYKGKLIGLLNVYMHDPHDYSESEIAFVSIAASHAAAVVENARLYKELVKKTSDLEREIHERKDLEQALQEQKEFLERIFEASPIGIGILELDDTGLEDRTLRWANDEMLRIFGFEPTEDEHKSYLGKSPESMYASRAEFERVSLLLQQELCEGRITQTDAKFKRKDGSLFDGHLQLSLFDPYDFRKGAVATISDITWRKQAEERLKQNQETARALLNAPLEAALLQGLDGEILALNDRLAERFGKGEEELIGTCVYDLFPFELARIRRVSVDRVIRTKRPYRFEDEREGRTYDTNIYPILDADGTVAQLAVFSRDVTEKKRAEQALQYSEKMYRTLFESTGAALMVIEEDMTIAHINEEMVSLSGYKKEELEGKMKWPEVVAEADREQILMYHRLRRTDHPEGAPTSYEFGFIRKNGELRNATLVVAMIPGTNRSVVSFMDMTERRKMEAALRESEVRFRSFFDDLALGILMMNPQGQIIAANKAICQLMGYSQEDLAGQHVSAFYHADDAGKDTTWYAALVEGEQDRCVTESRLIRKNGETLWARLHLSSVKDAEGNFKHATVLCEDVTGYKSLAETLTAKRQVVENLMAQLNRAEAALKESEKKYKEITEFLPDLIYKSILIDS